MPELPEVETIRLTLKNLIIGKKITNITVFYSKIIKDKTVEDFKKTIIGQEIRGIRRIGKYLLFDFENTTLISHLRMEGKFFIRNDLDELTKHEHIIFHLDNGKFLTYHDVRKFGTMNIVDLYKEFTLKSIHELGLEANNPNLKAKDLYLKIKNSNRPIKSLLLNQKIISGLGNIYVDETLYRSRINPMTKGKFINIYQVKKIIDSARYILNHAIDLGGTTIRTYQSSLGVDGRFQNELMVHTLVNKKCFVCHDIILKARVGGRGTYYCPTCQGKENTLVIGLTGGIASGKSEVAKYFKNKGIIVLDADKIYKNLLKTNKIMYNEIVKNFGEDIIVDNEINRRNLAKMIFNNSKKRELLNEITHPFIIEEFKKSIKKYQELGNNIIVLDIPLLFEANLEYLTNLVILVYVDKLTQLKRLMYRDSLNESDANQRINSQIALFDKRSFSDIIIDNSASINQTKKQFEIIFKNLRSEQNVS